MNSFVYHTPTKVVFGYESEKQIAQLVREAGGSKVLVLYGGGSVIQNGILDQVEAVLKEANICYRTIGGVQPNPLLSFTKKTAQAVQDDKIDFILAVGGGSVIDTAKAISLALGNPDEDVWAFFTQSKTPAKALPVGTVLTISAAGSEMSASCVQTNDEDGNTKRGLSHSFNRPVFAVMNPAFTYSLPRYQIACGVADIMMHTLDRYFVAPAEQGNELTDQIAEGLLRTVIRYGKQAVETPDDYEAASEIMWCGSVSHNGLTGLGGPGDFAPHQLAHELGGRYDTAHGASLTAIWNAWANEVLSTDVARFARYARNVWGVTTQDDLAAAQEGIRHTVDYFCALGLPVTIGALLDRKPEDTELREMAEKCTNFGARRVGNIKSLGFEELYRIYQAAL